MVKLCICCCFLLDKKSSFGKTSRGSDFINNLVEKKGSKIKTSPCPCWLRCQLELLSNAIDFSADFADCAIQGIWCALCSFQKPLESWPTFFLHYLLSICGLRSRIGHASYQRKIFTHFSAFQRNDSIAENIGGNAWITVLWITPSRHGSPGQHVLKVTTILSYIPSVAFANKCYTHALDVATQDPHGHLATGEWVLAHIYMQQISKFRSKRGVKIFCIEPR